MKNKLLKISALVVLISASSYFVYQNSYLQKSTSKKSEKEEIIPNPNPNIVDIPVLKTEEPSSQLIATTSKQNFTKKTKVSEATKIESEEKKISTLSEEKLDSIEKIRESIKMQL